MTNPNKPAAGFKTADNTPNAAKTLSSLRNTDYTNESAICDIADNSIDAGASVIHFILNGSKSLESIQVVDDGCGMDEETLIEAVRLGSDTEKNNNYDLGLYGMGLVTGSLSFGECLTVTSFINDSVASVTQDLEHIRDTNRFEVLLPNLDDSFKKSFIEKVKGKTDINAISGTIVEVSKIDRWRWATVNSSVKALKETLGQVFRVFISEGKCKMFVNGELVTAIDPIHDFEPKLIAETKIPVGDEFVEVKLFELTNQGQQGNKSIKFNIPNQGFYLLRNNREISRAQTLGVFSKHNSLNLFRGEFNYPGSLDDILNSGFTKQNISVEGNQSFFDKLHQFCQPYLKQIRNNTDNREKDGRDKKEDFTNAEKHITRKAHLLNTAKAVKEKRRRSQNPNPKKPKDDKRPGSPRVNITKKKRIRDLNSLEVKFRTKSMDKAGPLYSCDMEGMVTVIYWNIDHPFYKQMIIPNESKPDVLNPICYLIYSLAQAELISGMESDSEEIIEGIRAVFSRNLKVLMN